MSTLYTGSYRTPALQDATVADAMHRGVMACDPDASIVEVARMMATHHIHCIAVIGLSGESGGESLAWGVISDADVVRAGVREGGGQTARALACHPVLGVEPSMALREAGELMLDRGVSHVVVISPETQHPIGVLSTLDIAGVMAWGEA